MVRAEALREPERGGDRRTEQRAALQTWLAANAGRIRIQATPEGGEYERGMRNWVRGGRVAEDKPGWRGRGERSMQDLLPVLEQLLEDGESVVLLVDDRPARALLIQAARLGGVDVDMMATESFLAMLEQDYGVVVAKDAWNAISLAAGAKVPAAPVPDPVYVRRR
jgi:hypothetical protein